MAIDATKDPSNQEGMGVREVFRKGRLLDLVLHDAAEKIIQTAWEELLPDDERPRLEILAGPRSVLPEEGCSMPLVGLGPHGGDLNDNVSLSERVVSDLNMDPRLPFSSRAFSSVILVYGVEILRHPEQVFSEVARVLAPGGVFLLAYSSWSDFEHAPARWKRMDEQQRLSLVATWFEATGSFGPLTAYGTRKRYRSEASKLINPVHERAPVWIVYARNRIRDEMPVQHRTPLVPMAGAEEDPFSCPYCGGGLKKWEVPHSPFEIDYWYEADHLYICFNDACPYFERGWDWMWTQNRRHVSYRHMYNPATGKSGPLPVPTVYALKDGIVEEGGSVSNP